MQTAEFDHNHFQTSQQSEADKNLLVKFYIHSEHSQAKSNEAGRAIFVEQEYVSIRVPADKTSEIMRKATHDDKQRFPKHYEAFRQNSELPQEGMPLAEWPLITRSMVEELAYFGLKTVEQLAAANDSSAGAFHGFFKFKALANKWLESSNAPLRVNELEEQLASRDEQLAALTERLDAMDALALEGGKSVAPAVVSAINAEEATEVEAPSSRRSRRKKAS